MIIGCIYLLLNSSTLNTEPLYNILIMGSPKIMRRFRCNDCNMGGKYHQSTEHINQLELNFNCRKWANLLRYIVPTDWFENPIILTPRLWQVRCCYLFPSSCDTKRESRSLAVYGIPPRSASAPRLTSGHGSVPIAPGECSAHIAWQRSNKQISHNNEKTQTHTHT